MKEKNVGQKKQKNVIVGHPQDFNQKSGLWIGDNTLPPFFLTFFLNHFFDI